MASGGFDIAKAGWLYRRSTVLHRWKKYWFVLDKQGDLRYFEGPDVPRAEERIVVRACVLQVKSGYDCQKSDPPEGLNSAKACFLELILREKGSVLLCAESQDDMKAWQISLDEARALPVAAPPGVMSSTTICAPPGYVIGSTPYRTHYGHTTYNGYPGQVISTTTNVIGAPPPQIIYGTNGTTTVVNTGVPNQIVYVDDDDYRRRRHRGGYCHGVGFYPFFY